MCKNRGLFTQGSRTGFVCERSISTTHTLCTALCLGLLTESSWLKARRLQSTPLPAWHAASSQRHGAECICRCSQLVLLLCWLSILSVSCRGQSLHKHNHSCQYSNKKRQGVRPLRRHNEARLASHCHAISSQLGAMKLLLLSLFLLAVSVSLGAQHRKFYDLLGVSADADDRTLKKAYKREAMYVLWGCGGRGCVGSPQHSSRNIYTSLVATQCSKQPSGRCVGCAVSARKHSLSSVHTVP